MKNYDKLIIQGEHNYKNEKYPDLDRFLTEMDKILKDFKCKSENPNELLDINSLKRIKTNRKKAVVEYFSKIGFEKNGYSNLKTNNGVFNDYKGLYIYCKPMEGKYHPVYIGISQRIYNRINGHIFRNTKNSATWAYLMAKHENNNETIHASKVSAAIARKKEEYF